MTDKITLPPRRELNDVTVERDRSPIAIAGAVHIQSTNGVHERYGLLADGQALANALAELGYRPEEKTDDRGGNPYPGGTILRDKRGDLWTVTNGGRMLAGTDREIESTHGSPWATISRLRGPFTVVRTPAPEYAPGTILVDQDRDEWTVLNNGRLSMGRVPRGERGEETLHDVDRRYGPLTVKSTTAEGARPSDFAGLSATVDRLIDRLVDAECDSEARDDDLSARLRAVTERVAKLAERVEALESRTATDPDNPPAGAKFRDCDGDLWTATQDGMMSCAGLDARPLAKLREDYGPLTRIPA